MIRILTALGCCALALAAAACGGDGTDDVPALPTLAGTTIPTAVLEPSPTPICDAPAAGEVPASFPADVPVPPGAVAEEITTEPHLTVVFRVDPPEAETGQPYTMVGNAMLDQLRANGWLPKFNQFADGVDWDFSKGENTGNFSSLPYKGCIDKGLVRLEISLFWITP